MLRDESFRNVLRREVDLISLPPDEEWLPRTSRGTSLWPGLAVAAVLAAAFVLVITLNAARQVPAPAVLATPALPTRAASPSREPMDLAVLPQEQAVLEAFDKAGIAVDLIGASKFESDLGVRLPARVFIVAAGSEGADVLFVPPAGIGDIRVCSGPGASGLTTSTVFVNGRRVSSGDSIRPVYYAMNSQYFVIAYDQRTREALIQGLGLTPARC
jgi:hypothetical protein